MSNLNMYKSIKNSITLISEWQEKLLQDKAWFVVGKNKGLV